MMMSIRFKTTTALCAGLAVGCMTDDELHEDLAEVCASVRGVEEGETPATPEGAGIRLEVPTGRVVGPPATDLTLRGTAEHEHGFAIRGISVAGIAAKSDDFNFRQWSAVLPLSLLATLPRDAGTGEINLALEVRDSCGTYKDPEPLRVSVDASKLDVKVDYADPTASYVPLGGSGAATVTITADKGAVGARIRVSAEPSGGLTLAGASGGTVTLEAIDDRAGATLRVTASKAGTYTLIASSVSTDKTATIEAAGPPTHVPAALTLAPGTIRNATVLSAGKLLECWAEDVPAGLSVTLDGADLAQAPGSLADEGKAWILTIAADMALTDSVATVRCRDRYLQMSSMTITVDA